MKIKNCQWIFFDVGETLLNEEDAFMDRVEQVIKLASLRRIKIEKEEVIQNVIQGHKEYGKSPLREAIDNLVPNKEDREYIKKKLTNKSELEKPYPQSQKVLELLSSRYKIGIIANQAEGTASRLNKHGLMEFISLCYSSTEVGLSKPDILFFKKALEEVSCKPEMAVMVGDRLDNDIKPANTLNMWTIRILQGNAKHQEPTEDIYKPDFEINNIEDILNILI